MKYFNLIVSGNCHQWEKQNNPFMKSRVFEYTHPEIRKKFELEEDGKKLSDCLIKYPALILYETVHEKPVRLCKITEITEDSTNSFLEFKILPNWGIKNRDLLDNYFHFNIEESELNRTHWAVKRGDLLSKLVKLELVSKDQLTEVFPNMDSGKPRRIFVSYSHKDKQYLDRIKIHLRPIVRESDLEIWDDTRIQAGANWQKDIENAIAECSAAIIIVSADFLASEFIYKEELPPLLEAAESSGTRIIPIIVKPCLFKESKKLSRFQAVNPPGKSIVEMSEAEAENTYVNLAIAVSTT